MMDDFELHEFFHSPKNVLLKALLTLFENESITDINYPDLLAPDLG